MTHSSKYWHRRHRHNVDKCHQFGLLISCKSVTPVRGHTFVIAIDRTEYGQWKRNSGGDRPNSFPNHNPSTYVEEAVRVAAKPPAMKPYLPPRAYDSAVLLPGLSDHIHEPYA
jgi:hypothetical protein